MTEKSSTLKLSPKWVTLTPLQITQFLRVITSNGTIGYMNTINISTAIIEELLQELFSLQCQGTMNM